MIDYQAKLIKFFIPVLVLCAIITVPLFSVSAATAKSTLDTKVKYVKKTFKDCDLTLSLPAKDKDGVQLEKLDSIFFDSTINPDTKDTFVLISPVCKVDYIDDFAFNPKTQPRVSISYTDDEGYRPRIYYWDGGNHKWIGLITTMNRTANLATADIPFPYVRLGVFIQKDGMFEGVASWYKDKRYPNGAATDRYPVGTRLKVTNLNNGKVTHVVTTSTWDNPNRTRVIDLVSTAFVKIANLGAGLTRVRIEKIF